MRQQSVELDQRPNKPSTSEASGVGLIQPGRQIVLCLFRSTRMACPMAVTSSAGSFLSAVRWHQAPCHSTPNPRPMQKEDADTVSLLAAYSIAAPAAIRRRWMAISPASAPGPSRSQREEAIGRMENQKMSSEIWLTEGWRSRC